MNNFGHTKPDLIDRIYECAFMSEQWPSLLGELAEIAKARAGFLFVSKKAIHHFTSSTEIGRDTIQPLVDTGWIASCERFRRMLAAEHSGFLTDLDLYEEQELKDDPFYRDLLYPRGLGWGTGTTVHLPTGDSFILNLERERSRGQVERETVEILDELRPHLARSALMAARLQLERAETASRTLNAIGLAALVLDERGKVLAANALVETMSDFLQWRARDYFVLKDRNADQLFRAAMEAIEGSSTIVRSFPVRDESAIATLVAHVIPIRLSTRDLFVRCAAILVLTSPTLPQAPPVDLVQSLFDLTPAEARVARELAGGKTIQEIAIQGHVSPNTIRSQISRVMEKTGCNRQANIVALLTGISPIRSEGA